MAAASVFAIDDKGKLARMRNAPPQSEDRMQRLVADHPELVCLEGDELLLIKREQSVPDQQGGGGRWSLDHLFVTRDAVPVLVELKRASDTRLRREVVGQMLDYAANSTVYWQRGQLEAAFRERKGLDADEALESFLGGRDATEFWGNVERNLRNGQIRLVFVADEIPAELARIVEFLNEQMTADVRAVELKWFESGNGAMTLVPRYIGGSELAVARKEAQRPAEALGRQAWVQQYLAVKSSDLASAAGLFIAIVEELGGRVEVGSSNGSLVGCFTGKDGRGIYPLHFWKHGGVSLSFTNLKQRPGLAEEPQRQRLLDECHTSTVPLSSANANGFPYFNALALLNEGQSLKIRVFLRKFIDSARQA